MWRDPNPGDAGAAGSPGADTAAARHLSPALLAFALNPFRILRVATSATTAEAAFGAERVLTLARAEMSPDKPDPLPWLPTPGFPELQQAAQSIEEPLLRLRHQLLWFDFTLDRCGPALAAALRDRDQPALASYLTVPAVPPFADPAEPGEVAQAVNQANLQLFLASAKVNGLWPDEARLPSPIQPLGDKAWQTLGGLRVLPQAHLNVLGALPDEKGELGELWADGLWRWTEILNDPAFRALVEAHIRALDDDFAQIADAEAVEESVRTLLADLCAQELRYLLVEGRYVLAGALVDAIAESGLEPRVLTPAMRPVRQFLQAELGELDPLLEREQEDQLPPITSYLQRLSIIRERWLTLDKEGVLGLRDIIDRAVERIYVRLRQWRKPGQQVAALLDRASEAASAQSLRERIASLKIQQQEMRERVCQFCKTRDPDYDKSVVLTGKKETGREHSFNSTTIFYEIRHSLILRCARCATFHAFVRKVSGWLATLSMALIALIAWTAFTTVPPAASTTYDSGYPPLGSDDLNLYAGPPDMNYSEPTESPDSADIATPVATLETTRPAEDRILPLTVPEIRYCLAEDIRINAADAEMERIRSIDGDKYNRNVEPFNAAIADYNRFCASSQYQQSDKSLAESQVEAQRSALEAEGRARVR